MIAPSASVRHETYLRFARHNRRIAALRWMVPAAGMLILAVPAFQIAASMTGDIVPIEGIRLENDTLVIEGPRFEGRTATGSNYALEAARAESRVGNLDTADLYDLTVDIADDSGYSAHIEFASAEWTMSTEYLVSNEDVAVSDSTGARGVLAGVEVDWPAQVLASDGPVRFAFDTGAQLYADTMEHDLDAARWQFTGVNLDMVPQRDAGEARDPFAQETDNDAL
ncbi:hypothetical protein [Pelagibacterium halotolerans]|uniref:LPS export ABC transporter periplasmic protein LptC n=1 Tax=Pelagibacterium halotolerans (strain DSM 22347 / JCM 15775 / CGMCC 1.7692 / B2) TaxID=1082931 RepID=G4R8L7_PELHB|nr:hypothetical protein [Pelagibacterium halotolerans]AEQ53422.1 hypothetical protein KKY_3435 [Pelagibacterium halotolerans B2]QJR20395.1 hypothetical protein HKM20_19270 [Pelagibacterium halotolerans]SEA60711.1 lipopolysaccharide export system protein LptC [Pelagibacterium halotolerans]